MTDVSTQTNLKDRLAFGLFWSWNLIFLAFMVLGFAPRLLPELIIAVRTGSIPVNYLFYALVLAMIPLLAVILGLTLLRRSPARLFALGYVVEGPLMLILAIRLFLIRQPTPALTLILSIAGLGMVAFLWQILDPEAERRGQLASYLRLVGLTLMLLTSLYAAVWIAFYAVPLSAAAVNWLIATLSNLSGSLRSLVNSIEDLIFAGLLWIPFIVLGFILLLYTATLFVLTPIAVPILSVRAWWRGLISAVRRFGWVPSVILVALVVATSLTLFVVTNRQPQELAFALLEEPPVSPREAQALLEKRDSIRSGLLNAYLAPFRYISAMGEVRHVSTIYENTFHISSQRAFGVQQLYESVARPLLYDPVHPQDLPYRDNLAFQREPQQAAQLYQQFFDTTIVEGERASIVRAVRSTWSADQAEAAWQAVDDREIHLVQQEVNVSEHGDWAEVELYEVYQNQTAERQEVIYYFNLPESAVITGLWLGNSPDREARFAYQVAPRGAAQAVYRNETRQYRDPALVEQIGPRQYRLRVFPIPPLRTTWDENSLRPVSQDASPLYMWLTYRTLSSKDAWPLPNLALRRNVYWDRDTLRLVNGSPMKAAEDIWLPESVPASQPAEQVAHRVEFPGGESVLAQPASQLELPELPKDLRLAVVLDRSRSMAGHADQVVSTLARLKEVLGSGTSIDVYLTASPFRGETPSLVSLDAFDPGEIVYFGGQNAAELLAQFEQLRAGRDYEAILVLTDGSGYELGESQADISIPDAPVWMLHLGADIPLGYDDETLEAIQASDGGVVGDLDQALSRLALALPDDQGNSPTGTQSRDVVDGYVWSLLPTEQARAGAPGAVIHTGEDGFIAFAARDLILTEMRRQHGSLDQLDTLDRLHALAQEYGIVTPYSSMIVLVNVTQQNLLNRMEQLGDRYEREYEDLTDTTPSTQLPLSGVPEPEEWLLLSLAIALLLWYAYRQRYAQRYR
jgi:putative PEP-CTERM system integral membrane protein